MANFSPGWRKLTKMISLKIFISNKLLAFQFKSGNFLLYFAGSLIIENCTSLLPGENTPYFYFDFQVTNCDSNASC